MDVKLQFLIAASADSSFHPVPMLRTFLKYWLPVLLWMALIFSASADARSYQHSSTLFEPLLHWLFPQMLQPHVEMIHHAFRKCGHLTEYAVLALLLWRAIHRTKKKNLRHPNLPESGTGGWKWDEAGLALAIVFCYAASDE